MISKNLLKIKLFFICIWLEDLEEVILFIYLAILIPANIVLIVAEILLG